MRLLVSGQRSGLGRALCEGLGGVGLSREADWEALRGEGAENIIHCAFNSGRPGNVAELGAYFDDNLLLTERLLQVPHRRFIFISTLEVYPRQGGPHGEDASLSPTSLELYPLSKLGSEALVLRRAALPLILRCGMLLGPHMRPNSFTRMLDAPGCCKLTLSPASSFYLLTHAEVLAFIRLALERGLNGCYNLGASAPVELGELAAFAPQPPEFGSYLYKSPLICCEKARAASGLFGESSLEVARRFVAGRGAGS